MTKLTDELNGRYATKRMTGKTIPHESLENILEAARLAPSSGGLQPYQVFVISNNELKKEIHAKSAPQPQVLENSHLLVFANKTDIDDDYIREVVTRTAVARNLPVQALDGYYNTVKNNNDSMTTAQRAIGASRQVYIALGVALLAAAMEKVDASPMEGFNPVSLDERQKPI